MNPFPLLRFLSYDAEKAKLGANSYLRQFRFVRSISAEAHSSVSPRLAPRFDSAQTQLLEPLGRSKFLAAALAHLVVLLSIVPRLLVAGGPSTSENVLQPAGEYTINRTRATFIPSALTVQAFVPPVTPLRNPLPECRIDASVFHQTKDGPRLTLQLGEPSTAADIPDPAPPEVRQFREPTPEQLARQLYQRRYFFNLGATIYDDRVSVVSWTDPETHTAYEAVCGYDIGLLSGVGEFVHEGENYSLMLVCSRVNTQTYRRAFKSYALPTQPEVAPGQIIMTKGGTPNAFGSRPVVLVGQVIEAEKDRLLAYQAARKIHAEESASWHAAHPPEPKDETFIFRPHRGSRYLNKEGAGK